jgi:thioredoxin 1
MAEFIELKQEDFQGSVLESNLPVLVEFGAEWCVPCKRIEPILSKLGEQDWNNKVKLVKLDVDECVDLTIQFQIMGVPTIMLFVQGEPVERLTGAQSRKKIVDKFSRYIL